MTQDEIIRMALESGFSHEPSTNNIFAVDGYTECRVRAGLERFAALVADREKKFWMEQIEVECNEAVLAEREACAKVCEDYIDRLHEIRDNDESLPQYQPELAGRQAGAGRCAAAIRARSTLRGEKNV